MVLLAMTASIVDGLKRLDSTRGASDEPTQKPSSDETPEEPTSQPSQECFLDNPAVGNPIRHDQILTLWRSLQTSSPPTSLEALLRGSQVYIAPPPPKPEHTPEFKALMARLRRDEEARSYSRMVQPRTETFSERYPLAPMSAPAFAEVNRPVRDEDLGDDEVTNDEIHRQMTLVLNFLLSIVGVAATLWVLARWWSLPARLFLAMGGSVVVGIAEVAVYWVYVLRMGEAKDKDRALKEVKEVVKTWIVGKDGEETEGMLVGEEKDDGDGDGVRRRNVPAKETSAET